MRAGRFGRHASEASDEASDGRYHSYLVAPAAAKPAAGNAASIIGGTQPASGAAPPFHHRFPRSLSGVVLDLSFDAEQDADALYRTWQFQFPVVARRVLDGGSAVGDLRPNRGVLQSANRTHYRAPDQ